MKTHKLNAEKRDVTGKKVKHLRKKGFVPANIYGKTTKSLSVQVVSADFQKMYGEVGETGLIELNVTGVKEPRHVLVHNVQIHAVSDEYLHIDFHQVALKEKIEVPVPLTITGESPVVTQKKGVLIQLLHEVQVEALPMDLPEEIEVNLSDLKEVGDEIIAGNLKIPANVTLITPPEEIVARINELQKEEAPAPIAAAEGETPVEDAAPTAEGETKEAKPDADKSPEKKEEKK